MEGEGVIMREQLTKSDVQKIEEEIEYRKLVVRKGCTGGGQRSQSAR